jgi:hypothetical protein
VDAGELFEYAVLITNDQESIIARAQLYRERADCENVFDEIKNQRGWGGFMTQNFKRCRIITRLGGHIIGCLYQMVEGKDPASRYGGRSNPAG